MSNTFLLSWPQFYQHHLSEISCFANSYHQKYYEIKEKISVLKSQLPIYEILCNNYREWRRQTSKKDL